MKNIFTLIPALLFNILCFGQTPEKMTFQAVIRDASNALLSNQNIGMQISILQGSSMEIQYILKLITQYLITMVLSI